MEGLTQLSVPLERGSHRRTVYFAPSWRGVVHPLRYRIGSFMAEFADATEGAERRRNCQQSQQRQQCGRSSNGQEPSPVVNAAGLAQPTMRRSPYHPGRLVTRA